MNKVEFVFKSDMDTDTTILPNADMLKNYGNQLLDTPVGQTDMSVRYIFKNLLVVRVQDEIRLILVRFMSNYEVLCKLLFSSPGIKRLHGQIWF